VQATYSSQNSDDEDSESISDQFNRQRTHLLKPNLAAQAPAKLPIPGVNITDHGDHITIDDKISLLKTKYFYKVLDPLPQFGGFFPRFTVPKTSTC